MSCLEPALNPPSCGPNSSMVLLPPRMGHRVTSSAEKTCPFPGNSGHFTFLLPIQAQND